MKLRRSIFLAVLLIFVTTFAITYCNHRVDEEEPVETLNPTEDYSAFVNLTDVVPDAILEIRYFSTYNFVGERIRGYEEPIALITREAADSLQAVSQEVMKLGYRLKVYDAYRPQMAVDHFVEWVGRENDTKMKPYFYPDLEKNVLIPQVYIADKSGHTRGSTIDLTLFDMNTEKEVDMGGTFDWFGPESHPDFCGNPETGEYTGRIPTGTYRVVALPSEKRTVPRHLLHLPG